MLKKISVIKSTVSGSWRHPRELRETRRLRCARCNRVTIPKKKLLGKEK
jgi:hypothetical protein